MKKLLMIFIAATLFVAATMMMTSCGSQWDTPYESLDDSGNTVSVRYDAGEGVFVGRNGVTLVDVFNYDDVKNGGIKLLAPDDKSRGAGNDYSVSCTGHIFGGWYVAKTDADGNLVPDLTKPWNFGTDKLTSSYLPSGSLSSSEPVLTLCANWIPFTNFELYVPALGGGFELSKTVQSNILTLPKWTAKGNIDMKDFPKISGKTFTGAYLDEALTQPITTETYEINISTDDPDAENPTVKIYTAWEMGEWFRISTADQLRSNAKYNGCYRLMADIDMAGGVWPTAFKGNFNGVFESAAGASYKITGIATEHNTKTTYGAIFGNLGKDVRFTNVTFENVNYKIAGSIASTTVSYACFAGTVADGAVFENVKVTGKLTFANELITDSSFKNKLGNYEIGIASSLGALNGVDVSGVSCEFVAPTDAAELVINPDGTVDIVLKD